jgi:hypothetical protein
MFSGRHFKLGTSKRSKRGFSSSEEDSPHDELYVLSQSEAASSYASGSRDIDMEDVDVEFDPQAYCGLVKRWTGDSYQKAHTVCAYEKKRIPRLRNFELRYNTMPSMVT